MRRPSQACRPVPRPRAAPIGPVLLAPLLTLTCSAGEGPAGHPPNGRINVAAETIKTTVERLEGRSAGSFAGCGGEGGDSAKVIRQIADRLTAQGIMYGSEPLSDCSGMFHRVLESFSDRCPGLDLPSPDSARSSRDIGRWYASKGSFVQISDPLSHASLIEPGAAMFFGRSDRRFAELTREEALAEIEHLGIVVSVERDSDGNVLSYRLFHGRSPGTPAGITDYHRREVSRPGHSPFGNWDQQWIGISPLAAGQR